MVNANDEHDPEKQNKSKSWWKCIIEFEKNSLTKKDWKNQRQFLLWCALWAVGLILAKWTLKSELELSSSVQQMLAITPSIIGVVAVWSYLRFLRNADEMIQKIQMEGLAIGFGAGVIYGMAFDLLHQVDLLQSDATVVVMMIGWGLGQIRAMRRYL